MRPSFVKAAKNSLPVLLCVYLGGCALAWAFQEKLLFPASRHVWRTPGDAPTTWVFENVALHVENDQTAAWFMPLDS